MSSANERRHYIVASSLIGWAHAQNDPRSFTTVAQVLYSDTMSLCFQNFGLEYERYLKEVVNILETDEKFKEKLESANVTDIKVRTVLGNSCGGEKGIVLENRSIW